ncbi:putative LOB domain-containing protein [Hibiscus syriacus]|uniref:RING-type E3 ubiquitin transferase n=1 Tax=Hibiscus syriacus TaxID=106335 RepID=A0A6A2ZUM6_HIBSY|nr:putative LOB domain-containing protein [Hibiscus syriacus]
MKPFDNGNNGDELQKVSHLMSSIGKLPFVQGRNISTMKVLTSLFEELRKQAVLLLHNSLHRRHDIESVLVLAKEIGQALDILPLSLFNVTADIREQVVLLHKQVKRIELFVDPREVQRRDELLKVKASNNGKNMKNTKNRCSIDIEAIKHVFSSIGLRSSLDYEEEMSKLEAEAQKQAGTAGLIVVSNINNFVSLVSYSKSMDFSEESEKDDIKQPSVSVSRNIVQSSSSQSMSISIPDEFRFRISLDLMKDPVIVASGHTYDRNSIAQWINTGHHTCQKSGQSKQKAAEKAVDHISTTKVAIHSVKMTAEFLVGKLAMGSLDIQRQAAYELRLLAKTGMDNRRIIAEAGAILFLVTTLTSNDPRIQENVVTALLNLSIFNNKTLIMAEGAIDNIVEVAIGAHARAILALVGLLKEGTMTGKRDAATALSNLALYRVNKATIVIAEAVL